MSEERPIRFRSGEVVLEGDLCVPPGATRGCVVCHPHPLYGGERNNSVVVAVARALASHAVATLRFDFRGAGASGGSHDGGIAEVGDARSAMNALTAGSGTTDVALAGYSFGAVVAMSLAAAGSGPAPTALAAIAPPLAMVDASLAQDFPVPLLLVAGDRDAWCPRERLEEFATLCRADVEVVRGADHFFAGREREVAATVARWLAEA